MKRLLLFLLLGGVAFADNIVLMDTAHSEYLITATDPVLTVADNKAPYEIGEFVRFVWATDTTYQNGIIIGRINMGDTYLLLTAGGAFNPLSLNPLQYLTSFLPPSTAVDATENALDADYVDSPALVFDRVGDYSVVDGSGSLCNGGTNDITVEGLMYRPTAPSENEYVVAKYDTNSKRQWAVRFDITTANLSFVTSADGGAGIIDSTIVLSATGWVKFKAERVGTVVTWTINDGTPTAGDGPVHADIYSSDASISIGSVLSSGVGVGFYGESIAWAKASCGGAVVFEYAFTEKSGNKLYDVSGNGNDASITSTSGLATMWAGLQSETHYAFESGYSLYEHATSDDIYVPYGTNGSPLTITPPSGYTKTRDTAGVSGTQIHNGAPTLLRQKAANTEFLTNPFWSADGISYDKKSASDLYNHLNWDNNVIVNATAIYDIAGVLTWAIDKQWTPFEYNQMIIWLASQGSTVTNLVPAEVTAGTGIGPDLDWADNGEGKILLVVDE